MEFNVQQISDFAKSTTSHGFSRIYISESLPVKLMWSLFLAAAVGGFSFHLSQLILNYMSTPVSANISPGAVQFQTPDITVCSVTPISYTTYYETFNQHCSIYNKINSDLASVAKTASDVGIGGQFETIMSIVRDTFDPNILQRYLSTRPENFIVKCTYKGFNCSFTDFQSFWINKYGNCFRFAPSDKLLKQANDIDKFSLELVLFTDNNPENYDPAELLFYDKIAAGVSYEGTYDVSKSGGAILFYGDKGHFPRNYINLPPGVRSYVDFEMVEYHYVDRDSRNCVDDRNYQDIFYEDTAMNRIQFTQSKEDCQYRKLMELILRDCGCISSRIVSSYFNRTEVVNGTRCHFVNSDTDAVEFRRRTQCESDYLLRQSTLFNQMTDCVINCQERTYTPVLSMASWPLRNQAMLCKDTFMQDHMRRLDQMNLTTPDEFLYFKENLISADEVENKFATNFAHISLEAYHPFSMLVEEVESYFLTNLFSDIGGILGLYLGMSALTICELFDLVFVVASESRTAYRGYKERIEWRTRYLRARNTFSDMVRITSSSSRA